ncbi:MAG TPA: hypothetical protein VL361_03625 [Candidatus Limnocylindrales bacterium]|nr:hypothetical protein [Candidatus Limnocylindrales bacterium]
MSDPVKNAAPQNSRPPEIMSVDRVIAILWETAVESFIRAILVVLFGSIAIEMASGIWGEMVPSPPPGFATKSEPEATPQPARHTWTTQFGQHRFVIVFTLMFVLTAWVRLFGQRQSAQWSEAERHVSKITHHLSENWFRLIVWNAFGALISAIVLIWIQRFTIPNLLFRWMMESAISGLQSLAQALFGHGKSELVAAWFNWYGDNQLRFTFWFFYVSAICDDLGIPNFKTLGIWVLRRIRRRISKQQVA